MTAATSVKMSQKLLEQDEKLQEQEEKLQEQEEKLQEQEEKLQEQEERLQEQEEKLQEQEEKLQEQEVKFKNISEEQEMRFQVLEQKFHKLLQEQEKKFVRLEEKSVQNEGAVDNVANLIKIILKRRFAMENFSLEKVKVMVGDWKSPAMYTHVCAYKFCIGIYANGHGLIRGKAMSVVLYAMQGGNDHLLKWPARVSFTLQLLHQHGGQNIIHTLTKEQWQKPTTPYTYINIFTRNQGRLLWWAFIEHSELADFLDNDTLYFHLSNITVY